RVNHAHRVLDADELLARRLNVALRATEARKYQSLLARDEVRAVHLCRDVRGLTTTAQRLRCELRVGRGGEEVSAEREEDADATLVHRLDGLDGVESVAARRLEVELARERVQENFCRSLPDAHRSVALHVRVAAHGARACAGPAQLPSKQKQV